jgi:hypothetical protein
MYETEKAEKCTYSYSTRHFWPPKAFYRFWDPNLEFYRQTFVIQRSWKATCLNKTKMPSFSLIDFAYIPLGVKEKEKVRRGRKSGNKWGFT